MVLRGQLLPAPLALESPELLSRVQIPQPPIGDPTEKEEEPHIKFDNEYLYADCFHQKKESYCLSAIHNLPSLDPFADASKDDNLLPASTQDYGHVRIQQRNSSKTLTTFQWITDEYHKKKLVKAFKKKFACNGAVIEHLQRREVIQLQGDQCKNICQFLLEMGLSKDDQLNVHGF
ncbi:eukaryotic translation initiation factor 1-like [Pteronotus mesoamericanus]|uniref:eukaryotic translation initiation factor 1-like n=1 Tax=Pteronotus mesoamericanus TaxID=1884717 RepID=UPI0023EBFA2A|nr:eukaryotic translation initiation factor 1-like [Pteronotus parnellii mesoamericanus]